MPNRVPTHKPPRPLAPIVAQVQAERKADQARLYDATQRDATSVGFYSSARWQKLRALKRSLDPLCEHCLERGRLTPAQMVHHDIALREDRGQALTLDNLISLCHACHARAHA
jgi:5-methylcytosine-specific restriction enzyme A